MTTTSFRSLSVATLLIYIGLAGSIAWASPTGLNNIPTADVVSEHTLVVQVFGNAAQGTRPDLWAGFKYGVLENVEIGVDGQINADPSDDGALAAQLNLRLPLWHDAALGLGAANLGYESRNGAADLYFVLSQNVGHLSVHLGATLQEDNQGVFAGLDKTFEVVGRGLTARVDVRQTNKGEDLLGSAGFIVGLVQGLYLEAWGSLSSDSDAPEAATVKLDYVFSL